MGGGEELGREKGNVSRKGNVLPGYYSGVSVSVPGLCILVCVVYQLNVVGCCLRDDHSCVKGPADSVAVYSTLPYTTIAAALRAIES
jgi:hypothetical protein